MCDKLQCTHIFILKLNPPELHFLSDESVPCLAMCNPRCTSLQSCKFEKKSFNPNVSIIFI